MLNTDYKKLFESNPSIEDLIKNPQWSEWINSEIFVYQLLNKTNFDDFESLSKELLTKPAIILSALEKFYLAEKSISGNLSQETSFCMYCCNLDPKYAKLFNDLLVSNEELTSWYINEFKNLPIAQYLPEKYCSDESVAKVLLSNSLSNYQYLSTPIRNDLSIFKSLKVENRVKVYQFAGDKIHLNWKLSADIISNEPKCYEYASEKLRKDPDFYLDVLNKVTPASHIALLLNSADATIQDNEHCVWQTLLLEPTSLAFASQRLLNSTSFAHQVISSMDEVQTSQSLEYWGLHVKNSRVIFEELLPKIINANCLAILGPELKENSEFMLKAVELDSKQALTCCAPSLLSDAKFIISAYHIVDEKNLHKDRYDENSEQSEVFNFIEPKATEQTEFIATLYKELKDIFISIIYPKIKWEDNPLIQSLNICEEKENGLTEALEKILLKEELQNKLNQNNDEHASRKKPKI